MTTRAKLLSQLAKSVDASGTITSAGISSTVSLGATVYDSVGQLPTSGYNAGDQAFVISTSRLYINSGVGWYNVAVINNTPIVQSILDSDGGTTPFSLATDGTPTTITITAVDSDGDSLTYSSTADSDFSGLATISQVDNVFTITPFSQDSASTESGTITFSITDGINIANSSIQTFTLNFLSPLWDETVLSIGTNSTNSLNNSTFIDRSTNAHTVTPTGSPVQTAFHPYLDNWSVEFDGSGDTLKSPTSADFAFGTGDFTVEFWLLYRGGNGYRFFWNLNAGPDYIGYGLQNGTLTPWLWQDADIAVGNTDITPNVWQHHAVVRENGVFKIYLNGVEIASSSYTLNIAADKLICIGGNGVNNTQDTNGIYSNFRVVKGTALYTSNFTPPTGKLTAVAGTSLLTCQSNSFIDNSSNAHAITPAGNVKISAYNPFGQETEYAVGENKGSVYLDGSSYVDFPITSTGTAQITFECWVYPTSMVDNASPFSLEQNDGTNAVKAYIDTADNQWHWISQWTGDRDSGINVVLNQWNHLAFAKVGNDMVFYVNGIATAYTGISTLTNARVRIGYNTTAAVGFTGYVSDLKLISTGTAKYARGVNFDVPTEPLGSTDAELYVTMDNAGIFDKTGNHALTLVGDTATSTTQTKFADTAMYFDGSGDYIDTTPLPAFGTGDFTIEFWFNASTINSAYKALVDTRGALGDPGVWIHNTDKLYYYASEAQVIIGTTTLVEDTWYHAAACRSNGVTKLFLNGTQESSDYSDTASYTSSAVRIGQRYTSTAYNFHGYIENLQILKGVAKYTSNFTPPTQEQGRTYQATS